MDAPLLIVSNRGPLRFSTGADGRREARRGGGGLVTALSALTSTRPITWVASALSEDDVEVAAEGAYRDGNLTLRLVAHDREEYDRYYNVFANPTLWFIHHYLWGLALEPSVDHNVRLAWEAGYVPVNDRFAAAVADEIAAHEGPPPAVMVHDYQLFLVPHGIRARVPDAVIQHFTHIPWPQPDYWRVLPTDIRTAIHESMLAADIVGLHTPRYVRSFLQCVEAFTDAEVDMRSGQATVDGRTVRVRAYPVSVDPEEFGRLAHSEAVAAAEPRVLDARPEKLLLRVDRTDPSKNIVRGFSAFDLFLSDHPEWRERVTMLALLDPSRPDIPEYAEYVGAIQRVARAVNDRHYSADSDWVPVDLRISDDFPGAVAAYKHYDVLLVNAIFDGMNLIAKEAPLVNTRDGVLILSENTGAHQELHEYAISINPFDIQELADAIWAALEMPAVERRRRIEGIRAHVRENDIPRWLADQLQALARHTSLA
jgi:trehalose 6-phosphate synthase